MARSAKRKPLSEPELLILKTAASRRDRCGLHWPKSLKADVGDRDAIVLRGLLAETPAVKNSAVWRTNDTGGRLTLTITDMGRASLGNSRVISISWD